MNRQISYFVALSMTAALVPALVSPGLAKSSAKEMAMAPGRTRTSIKNSAAKDSAATNLRSEPLSSDEKIVQVLNRLTLGAAPGDFERVKAMGVKAYIAAQLNPRNIAESPVVEEQVRSSPVLQQNSAELIKQYRLMAVQNKQAKKDNLANQDMAQKNSLNANSNTNSNANVDVEKNIASAQVNQKARAQYIKSISDQVLKTHMVRAVNSTHQLQEVMVDFWFNHFNISINKGLDRVLIGPYEEQAIRPNALGKFRDILGATCYHPAMLFYLDNWQNAAAGTPAGKGKKSGLNENYARELMELHTLGVDGGYTQKDVIELARVLTGLSLPRTGYWGEFFPGRHDQGSKTILNHRIAAAGPGEIEEALDFLSRQPATAHHVAYEMAQYFVSDQPPAALVDRLSKRFLETDGDIKSVLSTLFDSPEFFDRQYHNNKYKSPYRYTVSILRATAAQPQRWEPIYAFMRNQGQPLYGCLTPDGYKNTKEAWLNSDALLKRINFATAIGAGAKPVLTTDLTYPQVLSAVNGGTLSNHTSDVISKAADPLKMALLLGSPEFMNY